MLQSRYGRTLTGEPYSQHPDTGDWYRYGPDRELSEINHQMIEKYKLSEEHLAILYQAEFKLHQQVDAMKVSGKFPNNFPTDSVQLQATLKDCSNTTPHQR
jgi:hypothetical protein